MRSLIDIIDFELSELEDLLALAEGIIDRPGDFSKSAEGKILATLFFEPSTRTRLSFESAMLSLGGGTLGFSDSASSSTTKGESLRDTVRTVGCYSDIIAMRHPREGAATLAAPAAGVPVINAGDGGHCHPTQTLGDLLTLRREKGKVDGLTIGLCGDLKYGRTVHSLINALRLYSGVKLVLVSPKELALPEHIRGGALASMAWSETTDLDEALPGLDMLYMTRVQGERFDDPREFERLRDSYILTAEKMRRAPRDMIVMHPLPRVNEISTDVDSDVRAAYFRQVQNGKYARMALLLAVLQGRYPERAAPPLRHDHVCKNPRCITHLERGVIESFTGQDGELRCYYCEAPVKQ